ncbi:aldehyde dehydrogenase (NADP(+)) [Aeoliella sp.]|uniref:aldehyde dehydrogenase (NADP(+)) n=1 Tax=Aeoliella sp. TaxID=2795800 RepID=UPI003CCBDE50
MTQIPNTSIIAGELASPGAGGTFHGVNASTGEDLEPAFHNATPDDLNAAVAAATEAFTVYRSLNGARRAEFLRAIATQIEGIVDQLVERIGLETALPEGRVRGETGRTVGQLRMFADLIDEGSWVDARIDPAMPDRQPLPRADVRSMLRPLGPVAVFGASNFPLAFSVAGGDTASALAAGCPVVVKAHPAHPGTSQLVGQAVAAAAKETDMPPGVFSLLLDSARDVGQALVQHPSIQAVGFTGSLKGGRALFDLAAARQQPIPVYAEMGSVNPQFMLPAALAARGEEIATALHGSVTLGWGQFCTKPGIVLTNGDTAFRDKLAALLGDSPPTCMLNPGIAGAYTEGANRLAGDSSVEVLVAPQQHSGEAVTATLFETTAAAVLANPALLEECFGPTTVLVNYGSEEELMQVAAALEGQLTASIHCDDADAELAAKLAATVEMRLGRLCYNQFPTGVEVNHAMVHGGPYPATTDSRTTSVGATAIYRFARPVCYQNVPDAALPPELQASNPLGIRRLVDGKPE